MNANANNFTDFKFKRTVEMVLCIDGTGSMSGCIDNVKKNAIYFYNNFVNKLTMKSSEIILRIKVIVFRDYKSDDDAMVESPFFELPEEQDEFAAYMDGIEASGGCDEDANGIEALYSAFKSVSKATSRHDRQVFVLFADTDAIPVLKRKKYDGYPQDMPDMKELIKIWNCETQNSKTKLSDPCKRLVIFAPDDTIYKQIGKTYDRSIFTPVKIHNGLDDIDFESIISVIAASTSSA